MPRTLMLVIGSLSLCIFFQLAVSVTDVTTLCKEACESGNYLSECACFKKPTFRWGKRGTHWAMRPLPRGKRGKSFPNLEDERLQRLIYIYHTI